MRVIILGIAGAWVSVASAFAQVPNGEPSIRSFEPQCSAEFDRLGRPQSEWEVYFNACYERARAALVKRSAASLECSKQADAQGLHGAERATFRSQCIASAGEPARQTTQQAAQPAASMTTQECAARYQAAQAAGTLAGRKWMEFRSTECSSAAQRAVKLVFPNGISPIYVQEPEGKARMHTCVDQYNANKATNASGGLKWIEESGGGYYSACNEHLRTTTSTPRQQTKPLAPAPTIAATNVDIFSYCKTVINLDNHGNTTIDRRSEASLAKALNTKALIWRCMDGDVFACATGASGSACQKMSAGKLPTAAISAFCIQQPNSQFVPMSVIGNSPASWKCVGPVPKILQSVQLDKRNFMKDSWLKVGGETLQSQALTPVAAPPAAAPLSQEEIDAFRKFMASWSPPPGTPALDVHFRLKRDGMIDGTPEVLSTGSGSTFEVAKEKATRTVIEAQPFKMFRPESYEAWKDMVVTFEAPAAQPAQQPQDQLSACVVKYEATKTAGTIGDISRENFLKVCALTATPGIPDANKTQH